MKIFKLVLSEGKLRAHFHIYFVPSLSENYNDIYSVLTLVESNTCTAQQNVPKQADMHAAFILCEKGCVNHDSVIFQLFFLSGCGLKKLSLTFMAQCLHFHQSLHPSNHMYCIKKCTTKEESKGVKKNRNKI